MFNLFRLSFLLLSCLRRLTHTFKHSVSTMRRQRSSKPVSIMHTHTLSCHLNTQASCFSFPVWIGAQFCRPSFSQAFFNCLLSIFAGAKHLTGYYCVYYIFLALPLSPRTSLTSTVRARVQCICTHMLVAKVSAGLLSRQAASWLQDSRTHSRPTHQADE